MFDKIKDAIGVVQDYFKKIGESGFLQAVLTLMKKLFGNHNVENAPEIVEVVIETLPEV